MHRARSALPVAFLLFGTTNCSKSPTGLEVLPETLATVQSAVDLVTTGTIHVPASCSGVTTVACPGGIPDTAVYLTLTRDSLAIAFGDSVPTAYRYVARVAVVTASDIPVSTLGSDCTVAINTTASGAPTVRVAGTATFGSQTPGGQINRLQMRVDSVSGLDAADVSLNGGVLCTFGTFGVGGFQSILFAAFSNAAFNLCGAPGSTLFEECPLQAVAARQERRQRLR